MSEVECNLTIKKGKSAQGNNQKLLTIALENCFEITTHPSTITTQIVKLEPLHLEGGHTD